MKILIADSHAGFREELTSAITFAGHKVVTAVDSGGIDNHFLSMDVPEIVVLDSTLPGADLSDIVQRLKGNTSHPTPYIILTGIVDSVHAVDDCLEKPFQPALLLRRLAIGQRVLELQQQVAESEKKTDSTRSSYAADQDSLFYLLDSLDALVYAADMASQELIFMNAAAQEVFGGEAGDSCWQVMTSDRIEPCVHCLEDKLLDSEGKPTGPYVWEFHHVATGTWYQCRDQAIHWLDGRLVHLAIATSITERVKAEEVLRKSEQGLRSIHDASFESVFLSEQGTCLSQNLAAKKMFGYPLEEAIGKPLAEWVVPEDRDRLVRNMYAGYELPYEVTALRKDGSTFPAEIQARMIMYQGRQVRMTALHDITDRKRATEIANEHERRFKVFFGSINDAILVSPLLEEGFGTFIEINDTACRRYGYSRKEFLRLSPRDLAAYRMAIEEDTYGENRKILVDKKHLFIETQHVTKNGEILPVEINVSIVERFGQQVMLAVVRDISERKKAEKLARAQEKRYEEFFSSVNDAIFVYSLKEGGGEKFIEVNKTACRRYGYSHEEFLQMSIRDINQNPFQEREKAEKLWQKLLNDGKLVFETVHLTKSGETIPVEISSSIVERFGQQVVLAVARDLTERKNAEQEVWEYERRYKDFFDSLNDAVFVHPAKSIDDDWPANFIEVNDAACRYYGYSHDEFMQMSVKGLVSEEVFDAHIRGGLVEKVLEKKQLVFETVTIRKNGEEFPVEISVNLVKRFGQQVLLSVVRDITERKDVERSTRELEDRYKMFFDSINDGVFVYPFKEDGPTNFIEVNETACRRSGFAREEFLNMNPGDLTDDLQADAEKWNELLEKKRQVFETVGFDRWGEKLAVEVSRNIAELKGQQVVFSVVRDITKRKEAEEIARDYEYRFKVFFDSINDAVFVTPFHEDGPGKFIEVNEMACQMSGCSREELLNMSSKDLVIPTPEDGERWNSLLQEERQVFDAVAVAKSGEENLYEVSRNIIDWYGRKVVFSVVRDVSQRKKR